ncbi:MAG TPA: FlgD immunoglobulin-like domain containing protein [Candidatus Latescibacteria bacterium]|nr:FlgD immunoglobulin-like domain containing protein [Candidatus Latescibacterota bacterium]
MKRSIRSLTAGGLAVLCLLARGVPAKTDSLTTEQRIQRVFPFQVGQQYEFQSGVTFHRPNGQALPPYTIAQITVTDTVINGKTYLHIPYWSSFGTEYYRLDDSLRIWNYSPDSSKERVLLNLGRNRKDLTIGDGVYCALPCAEYNYYCCLDVVSTGNRPLFSGDSVHIDNPFWWAYYNGDKAGMANVVRKARVKTGWTVAGGTAESDTVLGYTFDVGSAPSPEISELYGIGGPGASRHRQGIQTATFEMNKVSIGVFRQKSSEPWPAIRDWTPTAVAPPTLSARYAVEAFPNPFNATTLLRYSVPTAGHVTMAIYSIEGRLVKTLVDREVAAGTHETEWEGRGNDGNEVGSGVYVVRVVASNSVLLKPVTLLR